MTIVSTLEIMLRADMARLQQDMDRARQTVDGAMSRISASVGNAMNMIKGFAAALGVGAFVSFIKNNIDATDALNDMSARTKVAIEDLAGLAYAAKLGDTSLEGVAGAISKLGMNIGKDGAKFRELGVTATEPLEAFKQLADIFKNIQDPQQRAAFGAEALGKSWQEAAVLLDGGSQGISDLVQRGKELSGVTEQVAADAGKFNDGLDTMGFIVGGVGTRIAADLLPMLNLLVDDMTATGEGADQVAEKFSPLNETLRALIIVGGNVGFVLKGLGTEIGVWAAQIGQYYSALYQFTTLDFKGGVATLKGAFGAGGIGDMAAEDAEKARAAFDVWEKKWVDVGTAVDTAREKFAEPFPDPFGIDQAVADETAKRVADFLKNGEIDAARKKSTAENAAAIKSANDFIDAMKVEASQIGLTADQLKMMAAARAAAKAPTVELRKEIMSGALALDIATKAGAAKVEADLAMAASAASVKAAVMALSDEHAKEYAALVGEAEGNEKLAETFGKTKKQIELMTIARQEERLSQRGFLDLSESTVAQLEREIAARKRNVVAMGTLEVLEAQKKASDDAAAAQVSFWKSIDDTAHATFVSILDGSKDTATRLKDTFKNVFFDWLYQMTIKKWIINIGTSSTGLVDGIASAIGGGSTAAGSGAGGILGSASNLLSIGKTIYAGFTTGLTTTIGSSITSLGTMIGSEAVAAFGAGISGGALGATTASAASGYAGTAAASAGAGAAGAIPVIGWIITAMMTANGLYKQGWDATNGTLSETGKVLGSGVLALNSVLKKFGLSDSAANIFSGQSTISKLFGRKNPEIESQGLRGTLTATGTTDAENYVNILQKGGWFRSDKRTTEKGAASAATDTLIDSTMQAIVAAVKGFGGAIGIETAKIDAYTKSFDLKLTGDAEKDNAALAKLFADVGDELSLSLVPSLKSFATEGEALSVTLQRLAADYITVDGTLAAVGLSIKTVGVAGIDARENLIKAFGGLDALSAGVSFYQKNFLTAAQQLAPVQKQVAEGLAAMGKSGLKTVEGFNESVSGIDLSTTAGAELFAKMINLAPAFKVVADAAAAQAQVLADAAAALAATNKGFQDQIDQILAARQGEAAVRALEIKGMDASTVALYDRLATLKMEATAITALAATNKSYQDQIDLILAARQGEAAVLALEAKGMDASTVALRDRLAALKAEEKVLVDTKAAAVALGKTLLDAVDSAFSNLTAAVNEQKKLLESAHKTAMDAMQVQIDKTSVSVEKLKTLSDALHGTLNSIRDKSITSPDDRASALAQVSTALAIARASGAMPDVDSLKGALTTLSKDSSDQFTSYLDYQRANYQAANVIGGLADLTDDQLSVEQRMLDSLKAQKDLLQAAYEAEVLRLDGILETAKAQVDVLHGINVGIASIPVALAKLAEAIAAVKANPIASAPASIAGAYQQYLGRDPEAGAVDWWSNQAANGVDVVKGIANSNEAKIQDLYKSLLGRTGEAAGVDFWEAALAAGQSFDQIKAGFQSSEEYKKLHPFAVGTNYVPRDMPAYIHEGEAIIPAADNRELLARLSSPAGNSDAAAAEIRELRRENAEWRAMQEASLYAIAKYGLSVADSLEGAINGETPLSTKEVVAEETA